MIPPIKKQKYIDHAKLMRGLLEQSLMDLESNKDKAALRRLIHVTKGMLTEMNNLAAILMFRKRQPRRERRTYDETQHSSRI